jgi:hypothetical protein
MNLNVRNDFSGKRKMKNKIQLNENFHAKHALINRMDFFIWILNMLRANKQKNIIIAYLKKLACI